MITPLILDSDKEFLATLETGAKKLMKTPILLADPKMAKTMVADLRNQLSSIFINPEIAGPPGASDIIKECRRYRPAINIFILANPNFQTSEMDWLAQGVQKVIRKPVLYDQILSYAATDPVVFNAEQAIRDGKKSADPLNTELAKSDDLFVSIRAEDFLMGNVCYFDVYVRLGSGKYIKILQSGDAFSKDRLNMYISKGVKFLYLQKEMHKKYLEYCDNLALNILNSKAATDIKIKETLNQGEETLKFLETNGVDPGRLKYAASFIKNVSSLVKQLQVDRTPQIKELLNDVTQYNHSVAVTAVAGVLIRTLDIVSAAPVETIGMACLFHDLGLVALGLTHAEENEAALTDEQKKKFRTHPDVGMELMMTVRGVKPAVSQTISQHHERRNKRGFPHGIGAGSLSLMSEVVGLSDEYCRILKAQKEGKLTPAQLEKELDLKVFKAFSPTLCREFTKAFGVKPPVAGS